MTSSTLDAHQLFSELRALTSGEFSAWRADTLRARIQAFESSATPSEIEQFLCDYIPLARPRLTHWPDAMLLADAQVKQPVSLALARLLDLCVDDHMTQHEAPLPERSLRQHIRGVRLHCHIEPLSTLEKLATQMPELTHLEIELSSLVHEPSLRHATGDTLARIAEAFGQTLTHLSLPHIYAEGLVDVLDHLPKLTSLRLCGSLHPGVRHDWLDYFGNHPASQMLEALDINVNSDEFKDPWLQNTHTWHKLERVRVLGLPEARAVELMQSPALSSVTTWNLADNAAGRARHWYDIKTKLWTARAQGYGPEEVLSNTHVDVIMLPKTQRLSIFLQPSGDLHPSHRLEHLHTSILDHELCGALSDAGHLAYPNLTHLSAHSTYFTSIAQFCTFVSSPFAAQLHSYEPGTLLFDGRSVALLAPHDREQWYTAWYALITQDAPPMNTRTRQLMAKLLAEQLTAPEHIKMLARVMNLKGRSKLSREKLRARVLAGLPL